MGQKLSLTIHAGGAAPLPADWRRILDLLPAEWRERYEERAAMIEFDGGEKRATAERRAFECEIWREGAAAAFCAQICAETGAQGAFMA
jgi:hypothetical protein